MAYVQVDSLQRFFPTQPNCIPVQPAYVPVQFQLQQPRLVDYINAGLNQYLKDNWQDIAKWVLEELSRPEPRRKRRR
jgi:hypothetical protein